ncbi:hypothetical protein LXA43DRAFT_710312 [Ganoderma leucocontextum]|nr:hypothetical protein LXA43DRAFT_710312 [Ganoderma leucocontextum]
MGSTSRRARGGRPRGTRRSHRDVRVVSGRQHDCDRIGGGQNCGRLWDAHILLTFRQRALALHQLKGGVVGCLAFSLPTDRTLARLRVQSWRVLHPERRAGHTLHKGSRLELSARQDDPYPGPRWAVYVSPAVAAFGPGSTRLAFGPSSGIAVVDVEAGRRSTVSFGRRRVGAHGRYLFLPGWDARARPGAENFAGDVSGTRPRGSSCSNSKGTRIRFGRRVSPHAGSISRRHRTIGRCGCGGPAMRLV